MSLTAQRHREAAGLKNGSLLVNGPWRQARGGETFPYVPLTDEMM